MRVTGGQRPRNPTEPSRVLLTRRLTSSRALKGGDSFCKKASITLSGNLLKVIDSLAGAVAFNERALDVPFFPAHPSFHRSLSDDVLLDPLKHAARALGYALR
jgi:hypothetical protein